MDYTNEQVKAYIETKQLAWSPASLRSEWARLRGALANLPVSQGAALTYQAASKLYKPYSVKTLFIRLAELSEFVTGNYNNEFRAFLTTNALLFKNVYARERVVTTYEEAKGRIASIKCEQARRAALLMLQTGLRAHEVLAYDGSGCIIGKGAKMRTVYAEVSPQITTNESPKDGALFPTLTYPKLYHALKQVGLKPHTLRKLAASKLVAAGFREADLMEVMGWSSMQTASLYIQPTREAELKARVSKILS